MSVTRSEAPPVVEPRSSFKDRVLHKGHSDAGGSPESPQPDRGRATGRDLGQRFAVIGVWILMAALFAVVEPSSFLHWTTLQAIFNSQTYLVFLALSLLCTLAVSEFVDLSFASVFGLSATIVPVLVVNHGWNFWLAALIGLLAAAAAGVINGVLIVTFRVSTIVVTLGMSITLLGIALWMSNLSEVTGISVSDQGWVNHNLLGLPLEFYYGLVATLIFGYVLAVTPLGRHIRAVGSNHEVSRLAGVPVNRLRFGAFVAAGLLAGFGGILAVTQVGGFDPNSTQGYLSPAFAAVFLGTAILQPGRFNPLGTFLAIFFLETGILGLQLLGTAGWVSDVFYGGVLIIAVLITTLIRRRRGR
jgi:ribose transport system permease protein